MTTRKEVIDNGDKESSREEAGSEEDGEEDSEEEVTPD